jgi:hypothetical protein
LNGKLIGRNPIRSIIFTQDFKQKAAPFYWGRTGQKQGKNGAGKTPLPERPVRRVQVNYKGKGKHAKMERMWRRYAGRYGLQSKSPGKSRALLDIMEWQDS